MTPPRRTLALLSFACTLCGVITALRAQPASSPASAPAITTQPIPYKPTLMAHGTAARVWVAHVDSTPQGGKPAYRTIIRSQALPADQWEEFPTVFGQAVALASLQNDLAVLLDDGSWRRVTQQSVSTGPIIVGGTGPVLGWASSPQALYAIRGVEGGNDALARRIEAATRPATSPAARGPAAPATTGAATRSPPTRPPTPVVFRYERGQWSPLADLPPAALGRDPALTLLDDRPVIAVQTAPGVLRTWLLSDRGWTDWGEVKADPGRFALLATATSAGLWTIDQDGGMQLFLRSENEGWALARDFKAPSPLPPGTHRTLTVAGEELRLFLLKDNTLRQQSYHLTGKPRGGPSELPKPRSNQPSGLLWILQAVVFLIMVLVMLVTLYRRRGAQQQQQEDQSE